MKITALEVGFIPTNCYLLCDEKTNTAAVIDPGFEERRILAELSKTGCRCEYVILTHGHFDHRSAAGPVLRETGAKLVADADEAGLLGDEALSLHSEFSGYIQRPFEPLKADIAVKEGSRLSLGTLELRFLHTPGHTRGGCCIVCGDVIFTGDTILRGSVGRTDFPTASRADMEASARRFANMEGEYRLYPGHGCATSLSYEKTCNMFLRKP